MSNTQTIFGTVPTKMVDQGDGTFSLAVAIANGPTPVNNLGTVSGVAQAVIAVTGTAVAVPTVTASVAGISFVNSGTTPLTIGTSNAVSNVVTGAGNGFILPPLGSVTWPIKTTAGLWFNGTQVTSILSVVGV